MSEKLTDAQVAALVENADVEAENRDFNVGFWMHPHWPVAGTIQSLALEVQQARQRRCGNCRYFAREWGALGNCEKWIRDEQFIVNDRWICGDFTPKEERK